MEFRMHINEIMSLIGITEYLNESDKEFIMTNFLIDEGAIEDVFQFESEKQKIAAVIFYNIVLKNDDIKNRRFPESKIFVFTFKNLSKVIGVSDTTLYKFNNLFYEKFPAYKEYSRKNVESMSDETEEINRLIEPIVRTLKNNRRKTEPQSVSQKNLMNIFITTLECVKCLYPDKGAIKIKEFLAHVQVNLFLAGHNVEEGKLESIFGEFVKFLNFTLTDGRNDGDFVKVKDNFGKIQNKVYIELGR